jgi:HPt (histidine-containing phosphotransfer) domain-containing protein
MDRASSPDGQFIGSQLVRENPSLTGIVLEFVEGLKPRLVRMEDALRAFDFETLRIAAHQLKGSGGGFGYPLLSQKAARLEHGAKTRMLNDCLEALEELRDLCKRVVVDTNTSQSQ